MEYKFNENEQIKCPICGESANYREFPDVVRLVEQLEKYKKYEIISELFVDEQGDKYRQMWEDLEKAFKPMSSFFIGGTIWANIDVIKRKYFHL